MRRIRVVISKRLLCKSSTLTNEINDNLSLLCLSQPTDIVIKKGDVA
jgi:hypothetical protein